MPSLVSSPWMRRYPHSGFSCARRTTRRTMPGAVGGRPGLRLLLVSYLLAASLRCQASSVAGATGKISAQRLQGYEPCQRCEPHPVSWLVPDPADVAAQHRVLMPEYQQLSILHRVPADCQDSQAEYPANQQVDDLEQHPASQPSPRPRCWRRHRSAAQSIIRAAQARAPGWPRCAVTTAMRGDSPALVSASSSSRRLEVPCGAARSTRTPGCAVWNRRCAQHDPGTGTAWAWHSPERRMNSAPRRRRDSGSRSCSCPACRQRPPGSLPAADPDRRTRHSAERPRPVTGHQAGRFPPRPDQSADLHRGYLWLR